MDIDIDIPSGSVVVGIDGSESSRDAAAWAADLAQRERRVLCLVSSLEAPILPYQGYGWVTADAMRWRRELTAWAERELRGTEEAVTRERSDLEVHRVVSEHDPRATLGEASLQAYVIVVGTHGHGRVARMILGSVSEYAARHAECPVVVVRQPAGDGPVVAAVDDSAAIPVLEFAFHQASVWDRPLLVVHADAEASGPPARETDLRAARLRIAESVAGYREKYPDVVVSSDVLPSDDIESALIGVSRGAFLLVIGRRSRGGIREIVSPPVVTAVLERVSCPVAVVPRGVDSP